MDALPAYLSGLMAVVLLTAFVKIFTSLSIMRLGLGLGGGSFGIVVAALSFVLALVVNEPQINALGGFSALMSGTQKSTTDLEKTYRPFLEQHAEKGIVDRIGKIEHKMHGGTDPKEGGSSFAALLAAFLVSELGIALKLGLLFVVPFVVIDLLVAHALVAVGITNVSQQIVALPLKLLLFLAIDGWTLVAEKLLSGYAP